MGATGSIGGFVFNSNGGEFVIRKGNHSIGVNAVFSIDDIRSLAITASAIMNETLVELEADVTATVYTEALLFPITTSVTFNLPYVFNGPPTPQELQLNVPKTPPQLLSVEVDSRPLPAQNLGLQVFTLWTLYNNRSRMAIHAPLQQAVYAQASYDSQVVGMGRVNEFNFDPFCIASIDFMMPYNLTGPALTAAQSAVGKFSRNEPFYFLVSGAPTTRPATPQCMIQELIDIMPPIYFLVKATPLCNVTLSPASAPSEYQTQGSSATSLAKLRSKTTKATVSVSAKENSADEAEE